MITPDTTIFTTEYNLLKEEKEEIRQELESCNKKLNKATSLIEELELKILSLEEDFKRSESEKADLQLTLEDIEAKANSISSYLDGATYDLRQISSYF